MTKEEKDKKVKKEEGEQGKGIDASYVDVVSPQDRGAAEVLGREESELTLSDVDEARVEFRKRVEERNRAEAEAAEIAKRRKNEEKNKKIIEENRRKEEKRLAKEKKEAEQLEALKRVVVEAYNQDNGDFARQADELLVTITDPKQFKLRMAIEWAGDWGRNKPYDKILQRFSWEADKQEWTEWLKVELVRETEDMLKKAEKELGIKV